jgi:hypothetical protein
MIFLHAESQISTSNGFLVIVVTFCDVKPSNPVQSHRRFGEHIPSIFRVKETKIY